MQNAYVIDAVRTPIGKHAGALSNIRPDDLAAFVLSELIARNPQIANQPIEDVILGAANQAGEDNRNVARMALLLAQISTNTGGVTVNRLCASGLQAIMDAARALALNEGNIYIAGGVESMTRAPYVLPKATTPFDRAQNTLYDTTLGWRFINPVLSALHHPYTMGETAENVALHYNISRQAQDEFALNSQLKYQNALQKGNFNAEILPVPLHKYDKKLPNPTFFAQDEHPRTTTLQKLAQLKPAFSTQPNASVTAGNSSGINDGAAALLLTNLKTINTFNLKPLAQIKAVAIAGVDPQYMGIGPVPAIQKALQRAQLTINDIDVWELNEAFAAQCIACIQTLGIDPKKVNPNGGAIAIGHPLGCSGARISATLIHELHRQPQARYGVASMCIGVGQGAAIVYEKC